MNHLRHNLKKYSSVVAVTVGLAGLLTVGVALARNIHLKGNPEVMIDDDDVRVYATFVGLGDILNEDDVVIEAIIGGTATLMCRNKGQNFPAGQNDIEARAATEVDEDNFDSNGNYPAHFVIPLEDEVVGAPDCPNSKTWTELQDIIDVSTLTLIVRKDGTVLFSDTCTIVGDTCR